MRHLFPFFLSASFLFGCLSAVHSHPMDQYRMEVQLSPKQVSIKVMTTLTRVDQPAKAQGDGLDGTQAPAMPGFPRFGMSADGKPVDWKEEPAREMSDKYGTWLEYDAVYHFDPEPSRLDLSLDSDNKASFVLVVHYPDGKTTTDLLSSRRPVEISVNGKSAPVSPVPTTGPALTPATNNQGSLFMAYVSHGIWHILTGYDHMLFMAALVLAAVSLWDLVKVVTAFTLAHTVTLTLAVLDIVRLNERIVEPMIAASIVFVALQNIFAPGSSRGWTRLTVAFGFGLFHGLGFAGGLLDAMAGLSGVTVVTAIAAFSLGVELGHQVVVIPLYTARGLIRRASGARAENVSRKVTLWGSAAISVAGTYYLFMALFP